MNTGIRSWSRAPEPRGRISRGRIWFLAFICGFSVEDIAEIIDRPVARAGALVGRYAPYANAAGQIARTPEEAEDLVRAIAAWLHVELDTATDADALRAQVRQAFLAGQVPWVRLDSLPAQDLLVAWYRAYRKGAASPTA